MDESGQEINEQRSIFQRLKDRISPPKQEPYQGPGLSGTRPTEEIKRMAGVTTPKEAPPQTTQETAPTQTPQVDIPQPGELSDITPTSQRPPSPSAPEWAQRNWQKIQEVQGTKSPAQLAGERRIDAANYAKANVDVNEAALKPGQATSEQTERLTQSVQRLSSSISSQDKKAA